MFNNQKPHKICLYIFVSVLVVLVGVIVDYNFLPRLQDGSRFVPNRGCDGFEDQLRYVINVLSSERPEYIFNHPLTLVHVARLVVSAPFLIADMTLGPAGPLLLLCLVIAPLVFAFSYTGSSKFNNGLWYLRLLVLGVLLLLSGRNVLVAVGMGYLTLAVIGSSRAFGPMMLGSIVSLLSSGSALITICVHLHQFFSSRKRYLSSGMIYVGVLLGLFFLPPIAVKLHGFSTNAKGYVNEEVILQNEIVCKDSNATINDTSSEMQESIQSESNSMPHVSVYFEYSKIIKRVIYRSTIITSFVYNQNLRLAVYLILLASVFVVIFDDLRRKKCNPLTPIILICSLGFLFEGAGVWSILFPLMWRLTWPELDQ